MQSPQLKRQLLLLAFLFIVSVWFLFQIDLNETHKLILPKPHFVIVENENSGFVIDTKGCRIPYLDPKDPLIQEFIFEPKPIICSKENLTALVKSTLDYLFVDNSQLHLYGINNILELKCCYKSFRRITGAEIENHDGEEVDTMYKWGNNCYSFNRKLENGKEILLAIPSEEFVKVSCYSNGTEIYQDYFAFVNKPNNKVEENGKKNKKVSVLIIGMDSISRLNLHRQMPKTLEIIQTKLKSVEFLGYNKVDDNTFPNLLPVLSGFAEAELKNSCWPTSESYFDNCTFLWNDFEEAGFMTAFGEDASWMGMFSYLKRGFKYPPTNYYLRIFNHVAETAIGHEKWLNANLCIGTRLSADVLIDVIKKYALSMLKNLSFGFFWGSSLSHDYLNLPRHGDNSYFSMIETFIDKGIFDRSIVIFMSDHGMRFGAIRETYQGYIEERLPFLIISYPEWFTETFPMAISNLHLNSKKLTTPFDLYETLKDLIDLDGLKKSNIVLRNAKLNSLEKLPRGISLFLSIPGARTCHDADIINHWCTCHESTPVDIQTIAVQMSSETIINYINSILKNYHQCSKLSVNKVLSARKEISTISTESKSLLWLVDYTIMIETIPGLGMFEGTVRHSKLNNTYQVIGSISRINSYGNQSFCVQHYKIRLYCFCISS